MAELDLRSLSNWRGRELVSGDNLKLGEIHEIIYDYLTGEPVWIGLEAAVRTLLVPARGLTVAGNALRSPLTRQKVEDQPHADFGAGFDSLGDERHLYEYFGVSIDGERELRVLREGDDLPGLERVI